MCEGDLATNTLCSDCWFRNVAQHHHANADDLRAIWSAQNGRCALTGAAIRLGRASLDHITPICRGGTSERSNLQWVTLQANHAKRNLTNEEFVALCRSVVANASS